MTSSFWTPFFASLLAAIVTTVGIGVICRFEPWGRRNITYFICFAAGVLIAVSFLHIIPTAIAMNARAPVFLLVGYMFMHVMNRFLTAYVCDKPETADYAIGIVPMFGIGFHSFIDGVIYSVAFAVNTYTGVLAAMGMVLHEFPEGIVTYLLMIRGGFSKQRATLFAFLAAALTTPLGTAVSYPIVSQISKGFLGALLALSAGALIYVGATHLLPRAEREAGRFSLVALATGVIVAVGIIVSKG